MNSSGDSAADPTQIGPYKVLEPLGSGGMGEVYLAEQTAPISRLVAVKVIKLGMDTKAVLARFDAEQQALAMMDHPNIARVFDAGTTHERRPYFAMEYVRGLPLTEYCDLHKLSTDERLRLFISLCQAVQHAHQKGVIHRDLKPSNVLVAVPDGTPVPKVIDFGIAKAIGQHLTERTLHTTQGQPIGTPAYMSPEQAEMSGLDVDTRTDVYALGVMLYELLAGALPLDPGQVPRAAVAVAIRESDPPTPSDRFSTLGDRRERVATLRRTNPGSLRSELKGDLDWIVMKAMDKDRTRRYETVSGLALDIRRHLDHEPVSAAAPGHSYRVKKFVRRNRAGVMAAATLALGLLGGGVMATVGLLEARRAQRLATSEAAAARETAEFLEGLFAVADPYQANGREVTARDIVDRGVERVRVELDGQPVTQARLMHSLGNVYGSLGQYELSAGLLEEGLSFRLAEFGPDHLDVAESLNGLGVLYGDMGRYEEADSLHRQALAIREANLGPDHVQVSESINNLAFVSFYLGRYEEAARYLERAVAIRERTLGEEDPKVAVALGNLGTVYKYQGEYEEAEAAFERALEIDEVNLGPRHPDLAVGLNGLAALYVQQGKYVEAEPLFRRALAIWETLGADHPDVATGLNNLGNLYLDQERYSEAQPLLERALAIREEKLEPTSSDLAASLYNLGKHHYLVGSYEAAEPLVLRALDIWDGTLQPGHSRIEAAAHMAAAVYWRLGMYADAEPYFKRELAMIRERADPGDPEIATALYYLADNQRDQGKFEEADSLYNQALVDLSGREETESLAADIRGSYVMSLRRQGRDVEADALESR